jgi:hypothetical protein
LLGNNHKSFAFDCRRPRPRRLPARTRFRPPNLEIDFPAPSLMRKALGSNKSFRFNQTGILVRWASARCHSRGAHESLELKSQEEASDSKGTSGFGVFESLNSIQRVFTLDQLATTVWPALQKPSFNYARCRPIERLRVGALTSRCRADCLTVSGGPQPSRYRAFRHKPLRPPSLARRFLASWPNRLFR